jgi:predicted ATPase/DNA-binding SARP family transcriptional activator/Tfp pilus assembly protein PilF
MIRFRVLGGLELRKEDGIEVRSVLAQPRRTALLASLALAGEGGYLRRDTLMGRLWPDSPQARARHSLNQALYGLRRSLGRETVVSRGDEEVGLDSVRVWCDARAFETALLEGGEQEALELYRGELLPGFFLPDAPAFEGWLEESRMRLRTTAVSAAWILAEAAERRGLPSEAISWARRAVALSGEEEVGVQRLLRLLGRVGDRTAALGTYEAFARRVQADPGVEPSPETQALITEICGPRTDPASSPPPPPGPSLPSRPGSPLVGREEELRRLEDLLAAPHPRLVTLTGPGGVGKTRLAVEMLFRARDEDSDGAWFVPLAGVAAPELVPAAVGQTLGLAVEEGDPALPVGRYLSRRTGLLVLDNLEHLLGAAPFVARILDEAPGLRVMVTSREPLRLRGEWILPLEGLTVPEVDDPDAEGKGSVRLFAEAARRLTGAFPLDEASRRSVARICRLVEGIPLAIELAASWSRALSLDEIEGEIEASRRFLVRSYRDGPERHGSLEATFEQSWTLLEEPLRGVLARLSVFRGGFRREAAAEVAGAALEDLADLVEKSLLRCLPGGRYELLEVIREFAGEKLAEAPDAEEGALVRHSLHFAGFLERLRPELSGPEKDDALARAAAEMDNLRTAWSTATRRGLLAALRLAAGPLFTVYDCRGWHREAEDAFRTAAENLPPRGDVGDGIRIRTSVEGRLLARQGGALHRLGRGREGKPLLENALALAREVEDGREAAFALDRLSLVAYEAGAFEEAVERQRESLRLRRELDDPRAVATSLNNLGSLHYAMGRHGKAREFLDECLALQRRLGDPTGEVISLQNLGHIALALGRPDEAEAGLQESLGAARRLRHGVLTARSLLALGTVANSRGRTAEARRYFQPALARAMQVGAESLAVEAILGTAWALSHEGNDREALELVGAILGHADLEPGSRAAAERLLRPLKDAVPLEVAEEALRAGRAVTLRGAASRVAGLLPVE